MVKEMVRCCPPALHLRPSMLIDQFGHVECHHLLPPPHRPPPPHHPSAPTRPRVPLTPFLRECQSLAGRWLFKPCQIRRVMMSNMPATPETRLTVARPGCTGSYVSLSFPSSPVTHPHPATHSAQSEELRGCRERDCLLFSLYVCT